MKNEKILTDKEKLEQLKSLSERLEKLEKECQQ